MSDLITIEVQFFLISIVSGMIILVAYDILRIFRRIIRHHFTIVAVEDILFWIAAALFIFSVMYQQNNGIIRGFSVLGMCLGMLIYNIVFSRILVDAISAFFNWIGRGIRKVLVFISKPFRYLCRCIGKVLRVCYKKWLIYWQRWKLYLKSKKKPSKIKDSNKLRKTKKRFLVKKKDREAIQRETVRISQELSSSGARRSHAQASVELRRVSNNKRADSKR